MDTKRMVWIGGIMGSTVGSFIPALWGGSLLSISSLFLGGVGAIVGMIAMYRLTRRW